MLHTNVAAALIFFMAVGAGHGAPAAKGIATNYTRPLSFEPNRGQTDHLIDYVAHGTGYNLFLSRGEAVMAFKDGPPVRMSPAGANASAAPEPLDQQSSRSNYFIGNKPEKWHTDVANYAKVKYRDVYPGVDLIYYGNQRQLEYDFVVGPGANAAAITLRFDGPAKPQLERSGDLVMQTSAGELRWHRPVAYQEVNGERQLVACNYARNGGRLGFMLGDYDRAKALVIDPVLVWSTYLGGSGSGPEGDSGKAITVDGSGSVYITGQTTSPDFPVKNALQSSYPGLAYGLPNAFVSKFDAAGNLVYSTYLGGSGGASVSDGYGGTGDIANGIAIDGQGDAYITGYTDSLNFPIKNAFQASLPSPQCERTYPACDVVNAFVTKINPTGSELVYSTYLGGSGSNGNPPFDGATGLAVDKAGSAYVTGFTNSADFPIKNAFEATPGSGFVTKFDPTGTTLVFSTYFLATSAIAVDGDGHPYVTGTASGGLPTKRAFQAASKSSNGNAFVTKFYSTGTDLVFSTYLGGSGRTCRPSCTGFGDYGNSIAVDASGNAYVAGTANSLDFPTRKAFQPKLNGRCFHCGNAFATKFSSMGTLLYSTYLGGGGEQGNGIAVGPYGTAYITGNTHSPNFPTKDAFQPKIACGTANPNCTEAFVTRLDPEGCALVYSSYLGGSGSPDLCAPYGCFVEDSGNGIAVDLQGNAYVTGVTGSADFPIKNAFQSMLKSQYGNAFVTKISAK